MDSSLDIKGHEIDAFICILGNDGCGKSSICHFINQNLVVNSAAQSKNSLDHCNQNYFCIERSMMRNKDLQKLQYYPTIQKYRKTISELNAAQKKIDLLTYSYSFQDDWYQFDLPTKIEANGKTLPVYWVFIEVPTHILKKRISTRLQITVYEHSKCIEYFNLVYQQMCFFYGIPSVANYNRTVSDTVKQIHKLIGNKIFITNMPGLNNITPQTILQNQLQTKIEDSVILSWTDKQKQEFYRNTILPGIQASGMREFYGEFLQTINFELMVKLVSKWIKINCKRTFQHQKISFQLPQAQGNKTLLTIPLVQDSYIFEQIVQGQSKILFRLISPKIQSRSQYSNKVFILLKGTIYSHTKQSSGQIKQLPQIRAKGSMIFLEMLKRNQIKHSYVCINKFGVILSEFVSTNSLQIIFKKQLLGTDKHSYLGIKNKQQICVQKQTGVDYNGGIYVRFDWRNPNHILLNNPDLVMNQDPYYYIIQKYLSKQQFFEKFLSDKSKCKPIGDKCISEDAVSQYTDTSKIKQLIIETYCTFQYYANQLDLEILDGCFMVDHENSQCIWSEINPDCLRVKKRVSQNIKNEQRQHYDKDLWRIGGSASKELIIMKWKMFNEIFTEYFKSKRFMDTELKDQRLCKQIYATGLLQSTKIRPSYLQYYRTLTRQKRRRQVIGTIDLINGQPILVQQSIFRQKHSEGNLKNAWDYIKIMPQIVIVDIDGASNKQTNNTDTITQLSRLKPNNIYAVGGGIRDIKKAEHFLACVGKIIISSNLSIIKQFSKQNRSNIIVELSINQKNQVLTHARTVNTNEDVIQKIKQICQLGIRTISITFRNSEGKLEGLPRKQLWDIMTQMPGPIQKVIIAGGISSIDDLQYIWRFQKCVPQLGSAIWKNKIKIGQIYAKIAKFDKDGLITTVIKSVNDKVMGVVYLNQQALLLSCEKRVLYRYSRQHKRLMKKGETSDNVQQIQSINIDCDNDCLIITVIPTGNGMFCHLNQQSCFYSSQLQNKRKDIISLQEHILKSIKPGVGSGYANKMQNKPQLAIQKAIQQIQQLGLAQNHELQLQESADSISHLIMFWNSQGIKFNDILAILNERSRRTITRAVYIEKVVQSNSDKKQIRIGIGMGKHTKFIYEFMSEKMGIQLVQGKQKQRCYKIGFNITNIELANKVLGVQLSDKVDLILVSTKPKDMVKMMNKKFIDFGINYSNMVSLYRNDIQLLTSKVVQNLKLSLIKRRGQNVQPQKWQVNKKGLIASEYPHEVVKYMSSKQISSNRYTLLKITGHSQSYLSDYRFDYCDAIVYSGRTIEENNLQIESILLTEISVVLFRT